MWQFLASQEDPDQEVLGDQLRALRRWGAPLDQADDQGKWPVDAYLERRKKDAKPPSIVLAFNLAQTQEGTQALLEHLLAKPKPYQFSDSILALISAGAHMPRDYELPSLSKERSKWDPKTLEAMRAQQYAEQLEACVAPSTLKRARPRM